MGTNRREHQLTMTRTRAGQVRDESSKPYRWLTIWNIACERMACELKDPSFRRLKIHGQRKMKNPNR